MRSGSISTDTIHETFEELGSTLVVAAYHGRRVIAIEHIEEYCKGDHGSKKGCNGRKRFKDNLDAMADKVAEMRRQQPLEHVLKKF